MYQGVPLSERQRELLSMPTIASQMPVVFKNGAGFDKINGQCYFCHQPIHEEDLTGIVSKPIESVAVVEAIGVCRSCIKVTPFLYRLYDDMRITSPRKDGWKTWYLDTKSWLHKIVDLLLFRT